MQKKLVQVLLATVVILATATSAAFAAPTLTVRELSTAKFPTVTFQLSLPAELVGSTPVKPQVGVTENGESIGSVSVSGVEAQSEGAFVVLAIDSSGSMKGAPMANAQAAAQRFVDAMGTDAKIAIVAFADEPKVLTQFTDDRAKLSSAISSIKADGETAVYDAVVTSSKIVVPALTGRRSIVLLSDGTDTVSSSSLATAIDTVKQKDIPVYAVALRSKDFNQKALNIIAQGSGGKLVPVEQSSQLGALFEGIARELRDVWTVTYTSHQPETKDVDLNVTATVGDKSAGAALAYANPAFTTLAAPVALNLPEVKDNPMALLGAIVLAFVAVSLLVGSLVVLLAPSRKGLDYLKYYDQLRADTESASAADQNGVRTKVIDAVGYVAGKRGFTGLLREKLEAAGLPLRPAEYMTLHILAVFTIGFAAQLISGRLALSVVAIITATVVPILVLNIAIDKRRNKFDEQLPDILSMISSSLRGGWGIQQAIDLVVQEAGDPASQEFRRVQTEVRLGIPLDDSLQRMADRIKSADFQAAVTAIAIQREVGGNLAEVLDIVAATIRDRGAMRRQISALTAEGRLSAYILVALPIFEAIILIWMNPDYMAPFTTTVFGAVLALVAVALLVIGSVWLLNVTRIEV